MKTDEWLATLKFNLKFLNILGLWPKSGKYKCNFYTLFAIILIFVFVHAYNFFIVMGAIMLAVSLEDLTARMFITSASILTSLKAVFLMLNVEKLHKLNIILNSEKVVPPKSLEQFRIIKPAILEWKIAYLGLAVPSISTVIFLLLASVLNKAYKQNELPVQSWYPYSIQDMLIYWITYAYQSLCVTAVVATAVNLDLLAMNWMMLLGAQCDILSANLKGLNNQNTFNANLKSCIEHYHTICSIAQSCNKCYNMQFLGQVLNSALTLALTMFEVTLVVSSTAEAYSVLAFAASVTSQCFMYCWFGNELEFKSSQIPYSAFESDWTGVPIEAKKNLLIFIMRAQRPIKMSAINLFSLSLATFTTILRTSWSYFAVLRQVNAQD